MAFEKTRKVLRDKELLKKIFLTLVIVLLYRIGSHLPVPGVPFNTLLDMGGTSLGTGGFASGAMSLLNMFSGGALSYISLFSLSIMPYITATIVFQILAWAIPSLHKLQQEGESGANKINQYARYLTVALSILNAIGYYFLFRSMGVTFANAAAPEWLLSVMFCASLVGGSMLLMYMGEKITDTQIFNGASILIFVNVLSSVPTAFYNSVVGTNDGWKLTAIVCAVIVVLVPFLVLLELGQRRIPITYARQQAVGTEFAAETTYLPLKANAQGVIPIIFASAFTYLPAQIAVFFPNVSWLQTVGSALSSGWVNWVTTGVLILIFSIAYGLIAMNPEDTADNLAKSGAFIVKPRIAPGEETVAYIRKTLIHIVIPTAVVLVVMAVVPNILLTSTGNTLLQAFGGTSLLIMIGVLCQSLAAIDSQLTMSSYDGSEKTGFKRRKRKAVFGGAFEADEA